MEQKGIIEYFGLGEGHRCGYCGQSNTNISHGMWAHRLSCQGYEDLLNRGWRRSGKYVYKPLMNKLCCPMHTIRCDVSEFKLSKSQKKVLKKMRKYLIDGKRPVIEAGGDVEKNKTTSCKEAFKEKNTSSKSQEHNEPQTKECAAAHQSSKIKKQINIEGTCGISKIDDDNNKKQCRKAKVIRRENKLKRLAERKLKGDISEFSNDKPANSEKAINGEKSLEELIAVFPDETQLAHKLEVKTVRSCPPSKEFSATLKTAYALFKKYQMSIHCEGEDENNMAQFKRFLVDCPLMAEEHVPGTPSTGLGAFHQQYYIDGKLIAVGVVDILPHCLSSKYFFYDPDYSFLSLGTYSALREIYFIQTLQQICPEFKYYYMGYYIHSCQKMRYKGQYFPSFLLCPEAYTFQPIKTCIERLQDDKHARFDQNPATDTGVPMEEILVLCNGEVMPFSVYLQVYVDAGRKYEETEVIEEYVKLAGNATREMLIYREQR